MKDKVIVWGTGYCYSKYLSLLKYYEQKGDFEVVGVTSNERFFSVLDGYRFTEKSNFYTECVSILDTRNFDSGKLETDIPDVRNRLNSA